MALQRELEAALRVRAAERAFVLALGGFSVELTGASLVTNDRIPVPRFNYGSVGNVGRERQAAFFERALDLYFQRGLRPTFRVTDPVPAHLDAGLRQLGFVPSEHSIALLEAPRAAGERASSSPFRVTRLGPSELDRFVPFWVGPKEQEELRRALAVLLQHPNPEEELIPWMAVREGRDVSAALLYTDGRTAGIHGVATTPSARGEGAASALVRHALRELPDGLDRVGMVAHHPRIARTLETLGFESVAVEVEYELERDRELHRPVAGPPQPPIWRPPRLVVKREGTADPPNRVSRLA